MVQPRVFSIFFLVFPFELSRIEHLNNTTSECNFHCAATPLQPSRTQPALQPERLRALSVRASPEHRRAISCRFAPARKVTHKKSIRCVEVVLTLPPCKPARSVCDRHRISSSSSSSSSLSALACTHDGLDRPPAAAADAVRQHCSQCAAAASRLAAADLACPAPPASATSV